MHNPLSRGIQSFYTTRIPLHRVHYYTHCGGLPRNYRRRRWPSPMRAVARYFSAKRRDSSHDSRVRAMNKQTREFLCAFPRQGNGGKSRRVAIIFAHFGSVRPIFLATIIRGRKPAARSKVLSLLPPPLLLLLLRCVVEGEKKKKKTKWRKRKKQIIPRRDIKRRRSDTRLAISPLPYLRFHALAQNNFKRNTTREKEKRKKDVVSRRRKRSDAFGRNFTLAASMFARVRTD